MQLMSAFAENRKARFDYELLAHYEAGLDLRGYEVKAIKAGKLTLLGSHVIIRGGEAYLVGALLQPYQAGNVPVDFTPDRSLRLLLTKKELGELAGVEHQKGLTIIPISVYNKGRRVKLDLAIARGKKKFDKREAVKTREAKRQIDRTLKQF
jgi:SsrA-binding protein